MNYQVFKYHHPFLLESGEHLAELEIAYTTFGVLNEAKDNVIWVVHALTANSDVSDWWSGLFGEGKILDPTRFFIVCANNLGSCYGSTHALSVNPQTNTPYFHDFPFVGIRDMAQSMELLRIHLQINHIHLLLGGSQGGQIALEWGIIKPTLFKNIFLVATNSFHSAWGIAFNESQRMAIEADSTWQNNNQEAGMNGLKAARAIALISYRNYQTYKQTQKEPNLEKIEDFKASSYQQYQGEKLQKRFNAFSYWTLSKAMDSHNVGRNRGGGIEKSLAQIKARTLVVGIKSDILFPVEEQRFLAFHIPNAIYKEIDSLYGHDGFLIENEVIGNEITKWLEAGEDPFENFQKAVKKELNKLEN